MERKYLYSLEQNFTQFISILLCKPVWIWFFYKHIHGLPYLDWLVGSVNPKDWLIPKIDCNIYKQLEVAKLLPAIESYTDNN